MDTSQIIVQGIILAAAVLAVSLLVGIIRYFVRSDGASKKPSEFNPEVSVCAYKMFGKNPKKKSWLLVNHTCLIGMASLQNLVMK